MAELVAVVWKVAILGAFALLSYRTLRSPRTELLDITLMFGVLVPIAVADWVRAALGSEPYLLGLLPAMGLVAHPYAIVRVVDHLHPVPTWIRRLVAAGLLASWGVVLWYGDSVPPWATAAVVAYFVIVEVYAATPLALEALETTGPTRNRLLLASGGTFVVGVALLLAGASPFLPAAVGGTVPQWAFALGIVSYYLGFAPPRQVTRYWQQMEVSRFGARAGSSHQLRSEEALEELARTVERLVDPLGIVVAIEDEDGVLEQRVSRPASLAEADLSEGLLREAVDHGESTLVEDLEALPPPDREAAGSLGARVAGAVPIVGSGRPLGALVLYTERAPLFLEASLETLERVAGQVALLVENERLVELREAAQRERLEAEKEALEEADRLKSQFLATMSHEIRTPLNSILGMAQILSEANLDALEREQVETIETSGNHLLDLINDILDLSKIEAGKLEIQVEPFLVRDVVEDAVGVSAERAAGKDLELAYQVDPDVPAAVVGDEGRVRQVLVNLVGNAVKFTDEGEVVVRVTRRDLEGGDVDVELGFEVSDTGPGIPEDEQEDLFGAFTQGDANDTRDHDGTGLGLTICSELVDMMEGTIEVESTVGEGSTFRFAIPVPVADTEVPTPQELPTEELEGKRVLVVDDNATNRQILEHHLEAWGMEVTRESDPREALQRIAGGETYDGVLLDQMMPRMSGSELARRIREHDEDLPFLLLSSVGRGPAHGSDEVVDRVLRKPVDPETLNEEMRRALGVSTPAAVGEKRLDADLASRRPLEILVAEDNEVNQRVIDQMLGGFGYEPDLVADGREAVEAAAGGDYDLVLMDLQMPVMDGYEATARIREAEGDDVTVVALSAHAGADAMKRAREAGVDAYVTKPVDAEEIADLLGTIGAD